MLHVVLALDSAADIVIGLKINQRLQTVAFGKAGDGPHSMFADATNEIVGHADIQNAIGAVRQYINPAAFHSAIFKNVDGRDKPGHDGRVQ